MADDFYTQDERRSQRDITSNAIRNRNLGDISFDKATGGTIILGGENNTSGLLQIYDGNGNVVIQGDNTGNHYYDSSGNENVTINSDGLAITNGKISIENDSSQVTIDEKGVVSLPNFASASVLSAPIQTITSTSNVDITGSSLSFTTPRASNFLALLTCQFFVTTAAVGDWSGTARYLIDLDGVQYGLSIGYEALQSGTDTVGAVHLTVATTTAYITVLAGSHTLKARGRVDSPINGAKTVLNFFSLTYIQLGS